MQPEQSKTRPVIERFLTCWLLTGVLLVADIASAVAADSAAPGEWRFGVDAHLWAASIGGTTSTGGDLDVDFDEILDNLDFAMMGNLRASKNKLTLFGDFINMKINADNGKQFTVPVGPLSLPASVDAKLVLKAWIVTAGAGYKLIDKERGWLNVLAGARYLWLDVTVPLDLQLKVLSISRQVSGSEGFWDAIVGVGGEINLDHQKKWYLSYYGDVGTGDTDFTWAAQGGIGYRFEKFDVHAGYRYMDWNFDSGEALKDLDLSGLIVGARYKF